jgi:hypothetical protein
VTDSRVAFVSLWLALVFPSSFVVHKFFGWQGTIAYAVVVALCVAMQPRLRWRGRDGHLLVLAILTWFLILAAFVTVYPVVDRHAPGTGSDDDDALNLGAMALLHGHFPYSQTTYLGNVLHQMPGALLLAAPFVLLGTSALQNLFWLPLFFVAVRKEAGGPTALRLAWLAVVLSPGIIHEVVTGTGHVSNTIYVALGLWWLIRTKHRDAAAVAWGVALASRANFLFLMPLAFGFLHQRVGSGEAVRATALTCLTVACLTVPFYLHDPRQFGPLDAAYRVLVFGTVVPYLGAALVVFMGALAMALSVTAMDAAALFRNCALVQAVPVVAGIVLLTIQDRHLNLWYAGYGSFFAWFALLALVAEPAPSGEHARLDPANGASILIKGAA